MRFRLLTVLVCLFALSLAPLAAAAPFLPDGPTDLAADVAVETSQVTWQPRGEYEKILLSVTGPEGLQLQRAFAPGETVALAYDENLLPAGAYTYKLTMLSAVDAAQLGALDPDAAVLNELAEAQAEGNEARALRRLVQQGTFTVANGTMMRQAEGAQAALFDILHLDDVIIDGSLCVGFDCVNGESFGFDTIRLKENNLRIKAEDTSTSASFPTQDWQLTFNDTSNGGQNKFSVECISPGSSTPFTIEGCAPNHSLYVDSSGDIGFGTSTPVVDLHVKSGNTPTLRLEQDGSSGFAAQTWDVAGNEANFFIRDASNGSTLPFRLFPGAPSNALTIEGSTGDIGIGTTSPTAKLDVVKGNVNIDDHTTANPAAFSTDDGGPILRYNEEGGLNSVEIGKNLGTVRPLIRFGNATLDFVDPVQPAGPTQIAMRINEGGDISMMPNGGAGTVAVTGNLSASGSKPFRIDHPLDPANQYLHHFSIESDEVLNLYSGTITTDAEGYATVALPAYFEKLNRDYRYQLTVIGSFARAIVAEEIADNEFVLQTDAPNVKVSWQVTGLRSDPFMQDHALPVEMPKPEGERGTYVYPDGYDSQER